VRGTASAAIAAAVALLAFPAFASANAITVNSTGDSAANDGTCTLREAITAANTNTISGAMANECAAGGASDAIGFSAAFNGQIGDTIALGSLLPTITTDTDVVGGTCTTDAGASGPCVGVNGPSGSFGLTVDNVDNTSISGIAATGALTGIRVINSASGFSATNDWLGVKLDGTAGANNTGLFIDPDSSGAQVGDATAAGRNVFAFNNNVGLDIEGADNSTIRGNYFGVKPDGTTSAGNPVDIEITGTENSGGIDATGNLVGGTLSAGEAATPACDGPCNVIAAYATFGLDLNGNLASQNERPAGQTTIKGNLVGFDATGTGEIPNTDLNVSVGIEIGGADDVTIGGPSALDGNHLVGAKHSIESLANAESQLIQSNLIGLNYAGTDEATSFVPSGSHGVLAVASGTGDATVTQNRVAGSQDDAIETVGSPTVVSANLIGIGTGGEVLQGGLSGIDTVFGSSASGSIVSGNFIQNSSDNGLELQGVDGLTATGNTIVGSGAAGVAMKFVLGTYSTNNRVGGDTPLEENVISNSNGPAIEIVDSSSNGNVIARNTGSGNAGPFIDLGANGLGNSMSGPNGGIQAPVVSSALTGSVSGTAQPGATVRAFQKATAANGEIAGFLGSAVADGSGNWQVSYGCPLAAGAPVGVTQTVAGAVGTSEMAVATTTGSGAGCGTGVDTDEPQTIITKAPKRKSHRTKAKFRFRSDEAGSTFKCKLDRKRFKRCSSPKIYRHLKPGKHTFKVKATDPAGNTDSSPAKKKFTVLDPGGAR
jgi:CSLREA domain-containing protein